MKTKPCQRWHNRLISDCAADSITFVSIGVVYDIPVSRKYKCYPLYIRVPIKIESRFFERPLVKYCEVMRKQRVQNLSAIEVYLEVAQIDFMLPLD